MLKDYSPLSSYIWYFIVWLHEELNLERNKRPREPPFWLEALFYNQIAYDSRTGM